MEGEILKKKKKNTTNGVGLGLDNGSEKKHLFHVIHKVPAGDSPYVWAKHLQLVEKDQEGAIFWFWKAIHSRDRIDSALKDMAVVMKQLDRAEEAIEAVRSHRKDCSKQAQESLDNVLIDLYKKCGRIDEQIELLQKKLYMIQRGEAFNGKATKTARSHGKKFQVSIKQETSRILGNLGWAYMQQANYTAAEKVYRTAQNIDEDANKACNLCLCLIRQDQHYLAWCVLKDVAAKKLPGSDDPKVKSRVMELFQEIDKHSTCLGEVVYEEEYINLRLELAIIELKLLQRQSRRLPVFENIDTMRDQMAC